MSTAPEAFWIDRDYDREQASDGISRYGFRQQPFAGSTAEGGVSWTSGPASC